MEEKEIKQLLQSHRRAEARPGFRCPDENRLAAYVDGQLTGEARTTFESHVSACDSCLEAIAFLARSAGWANTSAIPAYLVARARGLVTEKPSVVWRWRWAMATAVAAFVVVAVSFVFWNSRVQKSAVPPEGLIAQTQPTPEVVATTPISEPARPLPTRSVTKPNLNRGETPSVRGGENEFKPILLYPREGSIVRRGDLEFRWQPGAEAVSYEVRLVTEDGSLKLARETKELTLKLGDDVELRDVANYYVTIVAQTSDGRFTRSDIVRFRVGKD
jgi:Putative zinc-finger